LGDGSHNNSLTPVQVSGLSDIIAIAAGDIHGAALMNDGTVWTWGGGSNGQLGNGTTSGSPVPVQVAGLANITAIAAGSYHSVALRNDDTVWAWGSNAYGQLGSGSSSGGSGSSGGGTANRLAPGQLSNFTNAIAIAAGRSHTIALKSDGTVWAWGNNSNGQLGTTTTTNSLAPVQVGGLANVIAVTAGTYHSAALKNDGTILAWGFNGNGQLGNNTLASSLRPVPVTGLNLFDRSIYNPLIGSGVLSHVQVSGDSSNTLYSVGVQLTGGLDFSLTSLAPAGTAEPTRDTVSYNPATGAVHIPALVMAGDDSGASYAVDMNLQGTTLTLTGTTQNVLR
jgi:alpha-tubulin suppressor-like RCC1 family protein